MRRRSVRLASAFAAYGALLLLAVSPATASESIESFSSTISTTAVGGHPNIETTFTLADPGVSEVARNITFKAPEGIFGNPRAINQCSSLDFALTQCPSASQAGLITLRANYE